jgi:prepilin-type N-terminal cleavage/methylation domain-containing protein
MVRIEYCKKHKSGFTVIELLVVAFIIALMSAVSIPALSKYGKKTEFNQKTTEIKQLIEQVKINASNPDKGFDRYAVEVSSSEAKLYGGSLASWGAKTEIKSVAMSKDAAIAVANFPANIFMCESPGEVCCLTISSNEATKCSASVANVDWLTIANSKLGLSKTIGFQNQTPYVH